MKNYKKQIVRRLNAKIFFRQSTRSLAIVAGIIALGHSAAHGEGFRNPPPGSFNLGRAGGRIAQIDDSSAIQQNPAGLTDVTNTEVQFTPTVVYISAEFKSPGGDKGKTIEPWKILPNLFASTPFYEGRLVAGIGITTPYGLGSEWKNDSSAFSRPAGVWRYQAPYFTELKTINFNPTIAIQAGEHLSLGAGLDVMWSQLTLKQFYPWFLATQNFSDPDGHVNAQADGIGAGANFGATIKITERQRLALTLRTPVRVDYEGDFSVDNVPAGLGGGKMKSDFKTNIKFPMILSAGYGIQVTEKVRLETDVEWIQFSNFKTLPIKSSTATALGFPSSIRENWKDTFTLGIGGDWQFAPNWTARAGYQYYESPVPDSTFSPSVPDADQNVFTIGLAYRHGHHSLEGAYGLDFYDTRKITNDQNAAFNGKYEINVHLFSFAYRYAF
jgi:long-chain fatty acid transport protein